MKTIAMIPARYGASRFSGKLLQNLAGKPVIVRTLEAVQRTGLFSEIYVVTDDDRIEEAVRAAGGAVLRSKKEHPSGSDRLAEASADLDVEVIVNVQGDEPFTERETLQKLLDIFAADKAGEVAVASLMAPLTDPEEIANPNNVKVVVNKAGDALYFSRAVIPYPRDGEVAITYYKHLGIYAYRKEALQAFTQLAPSPLERTEKLEQLRYLENGYTIRLAITDKATIGIDTPEDLERARAVFNE